MQDSSKTAHFDGLSTVTMQGGGVLGLTLLGQLDAIADLEKCNRIKTVAYAGASAGGLVAALRWAGYQPSQIRDLLSDIAGSGLEKRKSLAPSAQDVKNGAWSAPTWLVVRLKRFVSLVFYETPSRIDEDHPAKLGFALLRLYRRALSLIFRPLLLSISSGLLAVALTPPVRKALDSLGIFHAGGFTVTLDGWMRTKLKVDLEDAFKKAADIDELGTLVSAIKGADLPLPHKFSSYFSDNDQSICDDYKFESHRPRFLDFDIARYTVPPNRRFPALVLSVTNLTRKETLLIDSYRACFEHIPVADAVRATISFPFAFQPIFLSIPRDHGEDRKGGLATRQSLLEITKNGKPDRLVRFDNELCIDGGVLANFPVWALDEYLRPTLYGHASSPRESHRKSYWDIRLGMTERGERERFFPDDNGNIRPLIQQPDAETQPSRPLQLLAYRPMIHFGLSLTSGGDDAGGFASKLFEVVTSGARTQFERRATQIGTRVITVEQPTDKESTGGWSSDILAFEELTPPLCRAMFDKGKEIASEQLERQLDILNIPEADECLSQSLGSIQGKSLNSILRNCASETAVFFDNSSRKEEGDDLAVDVVVRAGLLHEGRLPILAQQSTNPELENCYHGDSLGDIYADEQSAQMIGFYSRRALLLSGSTSATYDHDVKSPCRMALRFVLPIIDRSEVKRGEAGTRVIQPTRIDAVGGRREVFAFSEEREIVSFGSLVVDIWPKNRRLLADDPELAALESKFLGRLNGPKASDDAMLLFKTLSVTADECSNWLTEAYTSAPHNRDTEVKIQWQTIPDDAPLAVADVFWKAKA